MSVTTVPIKPVAKSSLAKLWIGLALLCVLGAAAAYFGTRGQQEITTASGLRYQVVQRGSGPTATPADVAVIQYEGRLANGTVFDSSEGRGPTPLPVTGSIPGFSEALQLMNKGSKYKLWIPARLAYGNEAIGPIPPNSDLEFDVTLDNIVPLSALQGPAGQGSAGAGGAGGPPPGM